MESIFPGLFASPNIHPLIVHFPVALWPTALLFWIAGTWLRRDAIFDAGRWLFALGVLAGGVAILSGYLAADGLGHDSPGHDFVHVHRNYMLVTGGLALLVLIGAFVVRRRRDALTRWVLIAALGGVNLVSAMGADRGAMLVYGYGTGIAASEAGGHDEAGEAPAGHAQ